MTGDEVTGILDAKVALDAGFEKIPRLGDHPGHHAHDEKRPIGRGLGAGPQGQAQNAQNPAAGHAHQKARPGLGGRQTRPELWPANQAPAKIGHDVRAPDHREQPEDRLHPIDARQDAQQGHGDHNRPGVDKATARPDPLARPAQPGHGAGADRDRGQRALDEPLAQQPCRHHNESRAPEEARLDLRRGDDGLPFPMQRQSAAQPEQDEDIPAQPEGGQGGGDHHDAGGGPRGQIAGKARLGRVGCPAAVAWARHEPVFSASGLRPPKRRSRLL